MIEKVNGVSKLSVSQQQQIAAFHREGAVARYKAELNHAKTCGVNRGKDCNCNAVLEFKSESVVAADVVASAINAMTAATIEQTTAIREQTAALADVLARDARKVEFSRDNQGQITSAKIKDV